jgi:hypothetical protein
MKESYSQFKNKLKNRRLYCAKNRVSMRELRGQTFSPRLIELRKNSTDL